MSTPARTDRVDLHVGSPAGVFDVLSTLPPPQQSCINLGKVYIDQYMSVRL